MKVNVRYWTEFGGSDTTMNVEEIPAFAGKFTIMSVTPHEELCPMCNKHKIVDGHCDICTRTLCTPKETLEEAAEIFVKNRFTKQICGDESYPDIYASKEAIVESHILFAKWQQERSYSEEDFKLFARQYYREIKMDKSNLLWEDLADKCLEEFKKK